MRVWSVYCILMDINGCKWPCGQLSGRVWAFIGVHCGGVSHGNSLFSSYGVYDSKELKNTAIFTVGGGV